MGDYVYIRRFYRSLGAETCQIHIEQGENTSKRSVFVFSKIYAPNCSLAFVQVNLHPTGSE